MNYHAKKTTLNDAVGMVTKGLYEAADIALENLLDDPESTPDVQKSIAITFTEMVNRQIHSNQHRKQLSPKKRSIIQRRRNLSLNAYKAYLEVRPDDLESILGVAGHAAEMGMVGMAFEYSRRAIKVDRDTGAAWEILAKLYKDTGDINRHRQCLFNVQMIKEGQFSAIKMEAAVDRKTLGVQGQSASNLDTL